MRRRVRSTRSDPLDHRRGPPRPPGPVLSPSRGVGPGPRPVFSPTRRRLESSLCGGSSVGRASASQAEGRGFDPRPPLTEALQRSAFRLPPCVHSARRAPNVSRDGRRLARNGGRNGPPLGGPRGTLFAWSASADRPGMRSTAYLTEGRSRRSWDPPGPTEAGRRPGTSQSAPLKGGCATPSTPLVEGHCRARSGQEQRSRTPPPSGCATSSMTETARP